MTSYGSMRVLLLSISFVVTTVSVFAQADTDKARIDKAIAAFKKDHPNARIELNERTGLPKKMKGLVNPTVGLAPVPQAKLEDVDRIVNNFFNSTQALFLQSGPSSAVKITQKKIDPQISGRAIARVQQTIEGFEIYGAEAAVGIDLRSQNVDRVTSTFVPPPTVELKPKVSADEAMTVAQANYDAELVAHADTAETEKAATGSKAQTSSRLVVFDPAVFNLPATGPRVTWLIRIGTFVYFVDGRDGKVVHRFRDLPTLKARSTYDANFSGNIPGVLVIQETGPVAGSNVADDARLAHEYAGQTYDYYFSHFGRDSYDNNPAGGGPLISTVRYSQMHNAFWNRDLKQMIYGPGYATAPDVVGHEITHGVVGTDAQLQYYGESGAADESFADFFGVMVAASPAGTPEWKIGAKLPGFSSDRPLRNLADPHGGGFAPDQPFGPTNQGQPDDYSELVSASSSICATTTDRDNGCVHFNSGILSEAFYLAAKGGKSRHGNIKVPAVGVKKLEQVLYRTIAAEKLTSSSQFKDVARGSIEACGELAADGKFSITANDCSHLEEAYRAVGISIN